MRSGLRRSVGAALLVLVTGAGLLAMHLLVVTDVAADAATATHGTHASPTTASRTTASHTAASHGQVGTQTAPGSVLERAIHSGSEHRHELLGCLWLLAAVVAMVVTTRTIRLRDRDAPSPTAHWRHHHASQRAPPLATRLALVGISRR